MKMAVRLPHLTSRDRHIRAGPPLTVRAGRRAVARGPHWLSGPGVAARTAPPTRALRDGSALGFGGGPPCRPVAEPTCCACGVGARAWPAPGAGVRVQLS